MRMTRGVPAIFLIASLSACKVGPNFKEPAEPVPDHYAGVTQSDDGVHTTADPTPKSFWWREFHDPQLDSLEERAATGNLDLKAAYMRILEARVQSQVARARGLPVLNGTASYSREQLGLAGILKSQHVDTTGSAAESSLINSVESPISLYTLGFDASWELDLFGKVRRSVEAADAQSAGAVEARNDLLVSLQAEIAQTYFQLRAGQVLRQVVADQISAQQDVVELTDSRTHNGLANLADLESARAQLASLQSQLPPYELMIATSKHALAVLLGQAPEALDADYADQTDLPPLPEVIPLDVPSTLARRRPDIRRSEAALHAATAQVGVSVASLFPDVSLTGQAGLRNLGTGYLFDWDSHFYSFGPTVSIPIFQGGALVANVRLSRAQAEEATFTYRKTVLSALQEVEDGLSTLHADARRTISLRETVAAQQRALEVDLNSYRHGLVTYLTVLTVQLQAVQARQQLAQALLTQSTDLVKLYKALGGGWQDEDAKPL
jgi:multidrug efflux system outer membrane protein